jgi:proline iminopeptidase
MLDPKSVEQGTIQAGPFDLGYRTEGSGRPALVIGSSIYYPRTFSVDLRTSLKLVFVDHRGFGQVVGDVTRSDYELEQVLDDVERVRQHLGLAQVVIVGHSGHAYLALEYAKRYPQSVTHVVLIAAGPSQSAAYLELAEQNWQEAVCPERKARLDADCRQLGAELAAAPERRFITFCLRLGARSWFDPSFDASPLWEGVTVNMDGIDHLWGEVFRDLDIRDGLAELEAPVYLALGRFDYLVAPYAAWQPYRECFRDLTVRVFDRSSHTPQLEESEQFDRELLEWLGARSE